MKPISGFRLASEEKPTMEHRSEARVSVSKCDDVAGTREPVRRYRTIDSRELDGSVYIGEGNATLVVSLPRERKVMRFRKFEKDSGVGCVDDGGKGRAEMLVNFFEKFISKSMGIYANEPEIVNCSPRNLERWMSLFEEHRPEHRRHKKVVDTYATLLPDYTLLPGYLHEKLHPNNGRPTFCVEIKPKQGFPDERGTMLGDKCDYCRKQYIKLSEGKISSPSQYCPCDLFSGVTDRMQRAIRGLVDSPQNNFRIFRNGKLAWGENFDPKTFDDVVEEWFLNDDDDKNDEETAREMFFRIVREALSRPFPSDTSNDASTNFSTIAKKIAEQSLPENSILDVILRVQRLNHRSLNVVGDIYSSWSKILTDEMIYSDNNVESSVNESPKDFNSMPSIEELEILRKYLIFRIAKDCSVLMAFRRIDVSEIPVLPEANVIRISDSRCFAFHNAITDLDPKSVHSIPKHLRRRAYETSEVARQGQNGYRPNHHRCNEINLRNDP